MSEIEWEDLLHEFQKGKYSFGESIRIIRKRKRLKIREIASEVKKTPTYISDIERGNNKPPGKELMEEIFEALELKHMDTRCYLYDLAAAERGKVSWDIAEYIIENSNLRKVIRMVQRKDSVAPGSGDEFWVECQSKI
ncbi:MAG: helix-turn-helix domain-containing protein [Clostridium sp.]|nr:helix-turn-helix domain-containing protein [Clostridium sp.]